MQRKIRYIVFLVTISTIFLVHFWGNTMIFWNDELYYHNCNLGGTSKAPQWILVEQKTHGNQMCNVSICYHWNNSLKRRVVFWFFEEKEKVCTSRFYFTQYHHRNLLNTFMAIVFYWIYGCSPRNNKCNIYVISLHLYFLP